MRTVKWAKCLLALTLTLVFAFAYTSSVRAQSELPPAPTETAPTGTSTEVGAGEETPPGDLTPVVEGTPPPIENAPIVEEVVPPEDVVPPTGELTSLGEAATEETPAQPAQEEAASVDESAPTEPAATAGVGEVRIVNGEGETVSVVEQEVSAALDPWFMVGTVKYMYVTTCPVDPGPGVICNASPTPITAALDAIAGGLLPTDRTLYLEGGEFNDNIILDGTPNPATSALMTRILGAGDGVTIINGDVLISNLLYGMTFGQMSVKGSVTFDNNKGTLNLKDMTVTNPLVLNAVDQSMVSGGHGIAVTNHSGAVNLVNVNTDDTVNHGAAINNTKTIAPVTITNSTFEKVVESGSLSNPTGLTVFSRGAITLNGVSASYAGDGAYIAGTAGLTVNNSLFNNNTYSGLITVEPMAGNIAITNSQANYNSNGWGFSLRTTGTVSMKQYSACQNAGGVFVGVNVQDSVLPGATVVSMSDGNIYGNVIGEGIYVRASSAVSLTRTLVENNGGTGIYVMTKGAITLNGVNSTGSINGSGAQLNNALSGTTAGVSILNTLGINSFSYNPNGAGLDIASNGVITLRSVTAANNGFGASIKNSTGAIAAISMTESYFRNNTSEGLLVETKGPVTWTYGSASGNQGSFGAKINNARAIYAYPVTLNTVILSGNAGTGGAIFSRGSVSFVNGGANGNALDGLVINNMAGTGSVSITNTTPWDVSYFTGNNGGFGVRIDTRGAVTVSRAGIHNNFAGGLYINSTDAPTLAPLTMTTVSFYSNGSDGLFAMVRGAITITNIDASSNGRDGIYLNNCLYDYTTGKCAGAGAVTIKRTLPEWDNAFAWNGGHGLEIYANGTISMTRMYVSNNGDTGASLDNCNMNDVDGVVKCVGSGGVVVSSLAGFTNSFSNNGGSGLDIWTKGSVSLTNIYASNNTSDGTYIMARLAPALTPVTITATTGTINNFNNNKNFGLFVKTNGPITLKSVQAYSNVHSGAYLDNVSGNTGASITVTTGTFNYNGDDGLKIYSTGAIRLANITADGNDCVDCWIYSDGTWTEGISPNNTADGDKYTFYWNPITDSSGIPIQDLVITITAEKASTLTIYDMDNPSTAISTCALQAGVTTKCVVAANLLYGPNAYGFTIKSDVANTDWTVDRYTISMGDSGYESSNGANGIEAYAYYLYNGSFSLTNTPGYRNSTSNNMSTGIIFSGNGAITLQNVTSNGNIGYGAWLSNQNYDKPNLYSTVNVKGINEFAFNYLDGLHILSTAAVTVLDSDMYNNGGHGGYIDNDSPLKSPVTISSVIPNLNWIVGASDNGKSGLMINTNGAVTIKRVDASRNAESGIELTTSNPGSPIMISNSMANYNSKGIGLSIDANGPVTLSSIQANGNFGNGAAIEGYNRSVNVSVLKSVFNTNTGSGIIIMTDGNVMLNGITANYNDIAGIGVYATGTLSTITVSNTLGQNYAYGNEFAGIHLISRKNMVVNGVNAGWNGSSANVGNGLFVKSVEGTVSVSNSLAEYNSDSGIVVEAFGAVTLIKVTSYSNGVSSVYDNTVSRNGFGLDATSQGGNLTLTSCTFAGNYGLGYHADLNLPVNRVISTAIYIYGNLEGGASGPESIIV